MDYTILTYHGVLPESEVAGLSGAQRRYVVSAEEFAAQVACLKAQQTCVLTFKQLAAHLSNGATLPEKAVILTFDDGLENNHRVALPILREHGLAATFFVVTGNLGRPGCMSWEQAAEMAAAGMEIGSHGVTHANLGEVGAEEARRELLDSAETIAARLGSPPVALSLPHGGGASLIAGLGPLPYRFVCTSSWGYNDAGSDPLALKRLPLRHGDPVARFTAFATINKGYITRCQLGKALINTSKVLLGRGAYATVRRLLLGGSRPK